MLLGQANIFNRLPSSPSHTTFRHSITLQVIYESELGFLELRDYTVSAGDAPLIDTIRTAFPEVIRFMHA